MSALSFLVVGSPAPQGSKRHVGRGIMVESSKKVKPWRQDVKAAALTARHDTGHDTFTGPVILTVTFVLPRPKHHYRTGRYGHLLRDNAPQLVARTPDVDKLLRSSFDALGEAGVWRDDAQVASVQASKHYADPGQLPGAAFCIDEVAAA